MRTLRRQSRIEEVLITNKATAPQETVETNNKVATNQQQTDNKLITKVATNQQQTDNKLATENDKRIESGNKVGTQPTTLSATKWQQSDNKVATNVAFSALVGLQRNTVLFLYDACKLARSKSTASLTLEHIAKSLKTSSGSAKTTLQRLEKKKCINRNSFKNGRGGWSKYELSESLFREMLQMETENKVTTNWQQTENKVVAKPATQPATSSFSSSSSYINTTTTEIKKSDDGLDTTKIPEELRKYGFSENHLMQLKRDSKLPLESILSSIEAFAHDLAFEDVKRKIRSPIALIMKLLKAGEPYLSEKGFEAQEDRLFREYVQRAEKQKQEKNKLLEKFLELKFDEWLESISDEQKKTLATRIGDFMGLLHRQDLKEYFKKNEMDKIVMENF